MSSPTDVVQKEIADLRVLLDSLKDKRGICERGAIRQRARLSQSMMLYVSDLADTGHPTWKELAQVTHKILIETADVERYSKGGAFR